MTENQNLTTSFGIPVGDSQNSLTARSNSPILFQDFYLIKKLAHFNLISLEQLEKIFDRLEC